MIPAATEAQIRASVVQRITDIPGSRKVYGRIRRPAENNEDQIQALYNNDDGILFVVFVRFIGLQRVTDGFDETTSINYFYEIEVRRALNETEVDGEASEERFNAFLTVDMVDALEDVHLGFDAGVNTRGFEILQGIQRDSEFYSKDVHTAFCRLVVNVSEC